MPISLDLVPSTVRQATELIASIASREERERIGSPIHPTIISVWDSPFARLVRDSAAAKKGQDSEWLSVSTLHCRHQRP